VVHVETVVAQSRRLSGLTYALGRFVAVGEQGTILTSTDGQTWTARNSGSAENLNGVAGGAAGYLAVGSRGAMLASANGVDWTARSYSPVGKGDLQVAAYGHQTFVAVSRNYPLSTSTLFRSVDGVTWTPASNSIPNYVNSIAYANGLFVAVTEYTAQSKATAFTSGDGWFWSPTYTGVERSLYDVIYTGTMFLAAGDRGTLLFSSDGYGWSPLVLDGGERFQKLVYGQGSLVAIGYDKMLHSSTGLSWSSVDTKYWGKFNDLAYGNGMFVAVGDNGAILNSADGRNWDYRYAGTNGRLNAVSFSNGHFVAVGDEGLILTSPYGRSWVVRSSPTGAGLRAVIGGDQGTLAVGDGGVILSAAAGLPGVNLTAAVPTAPVGRTIAISVNSTAIPNPEYQLWLQNATDGSWSNLGPYSSREEWELSRTQPGDYTLIAYAKSSGQPESTARASNALSLSFTKEQAVTGLTVSGPSGAQPVGSSAIFTATATDAGGVPLYQFWLHDAAGWRQLRAYSELNTYTLSNLQPGSYVLAVYALDAGDVAAGNWGAAFYRVFILNVGSTVSLSREPWLPSVGNQITFIASGLGLTGAEYQFWIRDPDNNWFQTGDYNSNNTYRFIPLQAGSYRTVVFAKDHYAPATDQFAVSSEMEFTVIPG